MRVFISFRYTGETYESLTVFFRPLCDGLEKRGYTVFCSLWKEDEYRRRQLGVGDMLKDALLELDSADALLAVVRSNDRSEGMLMEVGYALAKQKPVLCLTAPGVQTFISELAGGNASYAGPNDVLDKSISLLEKL